MNILIFFPVVIFLAVIYLLVGVHAARNVRSTTDYFLAGRNLGLWSVMFTLLATQIGGGMLLGTAQEAYQVGLYGILYNLSMVIGFFLLGSTVAGKLQTMSVSTTAELFEARYHSVSLKKIASLLSIITLCGILISQIVASKSLLLSLQVHNEYIFTCFWSFVILYTVLGGLHAVVVADTYQVIYILCIFILTILMSLLGTKGIALNRMASTLFSAVEYSPSHFIATLLMPALFSLIEQDLAQRFFAARSKKIAMFAALGASGLLLAFSLIPIYFGMQARLLGILCPQGTNPLIPAIAALTNEYIVIGAVCGIIAAITSTADSLLCAISSNITQDFLAATSFFSARLLMVSKVVTCMVGVGAFIIAHHVPSQIITLLVNSYALSVNFLFVPLIFAYYSKTVYRQAAGLSMGGALVGYIGYYMLNTSVITELLPLMGSLIGYVVGVVYMVRSR